MSVTALLDWFRPGTDVGQVVARVDEFVPPFYDGGKREEDFAGHIAEPIDAARWAPVFNRFEVPCRIGISTFGRVTTAASGGRAILGDYEAIAYLTSDKTPLVGTSRLPTGEFTLKLRVTEGDARHFLGAGETIDAVFATSESVGKAYEAARQMKGYCEGVAFFRWPAEREFMVPSPAAVLRGLPGGAGSAVLGPRRGVVRHAAPRAAGAQPAHQPDERRERGGPGRRDGPAAGTSGPIVVCVPSGASSAVRSTCRTCSTPGSPTASCWRA